MQYTKHAKHLFETQKQTHTDIHRYADTYSMCVYKYAHLWSTVCTFQFYISPIKLWHYFCVKIHETFPRRHKNISTF